MNVDAVLSAVYRVRVRWHVSPVNSNALISCFGFDVLNCCWCVMEPLCLSQDWRQLPFAFVAQRQSLVVGLLCAFTVDRSTIGGDSTYHALS